MKKTNGKFIQRLIILLIFALTGASLAGLGTAQANALEHSLKTTRNSVVLDGKPGRIVYKSTGDLDRDGCKESVFSVWLGDTAFFTVVARPMANGWAVVAVNRTAYSFSRADVADVNGDGKLEVVTRTMSGDGHYICDIQVLKNKTLVGFTSTQYPFGQTRFSDLDHDGNLEVLSVTDPSYGFLGDFWLDVYKWNGAKYVDVSRQFPKQYAQVIRRIRKMIYNLQFTRDYGRPQQPNGNPVFGDLYYYLGRAYEYRGQSDKARVQYAIAYRLYPDAAWIKSAFHQNFRR